VRVPIVADLHANPGAIRALPSDYDRLWVLGDLVNYGPNPAEVIEFVREKAAIVVRGNHPPPERARIFSRTETVVSDERRFSP
jgi:predicted phosphodiesterase